MVQLHHIDAHVIRLYVRLRAYRLAQLRYSFDQRNLLQVQLVPQLIINYKLKVGNTSVYTGLSQIPCQSVAHMPMKAMIYKTLSTVVDDFFA